MSRIAAQLKAQDMEKPQLLFEHPPTNRELGPFKPLLQTKPHAAIPLETEPVATGELSRLQYAPNLLTCLRFSLSTCTSSCVSDIYMPVNRA